ncbi:MAG TPA: tetratricopeptide repeat protein, partial [Methylocystis sp.]|nr:tetratricopeptide repeat protein [Methylocystis sp.]
MGAPYETRAFLAVGLLITAGATARAEVVAVTEQQQAAFEQMIHAPLDHQNTFSYITASTQNLDYEGAIAALERILAYNPHLTRAHYELGVLYFRLRSYAQAVIHFEEALAAKDLDPALARRIEGYLPEARKQLQRSRFTGILQFGVRYNSNLTGAPGSDFVQAFGVDVPSLRPYQKAADGSFFGAGE